MQIRSTSPQRTSSSRTRGAYFSVFPAHLACGLRTLVYTHKLSSSRGTLATKGTSSKWLGELNPAKTSVTTFGIDEYHASCLASAGLVYGVISGNDTQRAVAEGVLREMEEVLRRSTADLALAESGGEGSIQSSFGPKIKQLLDYANANPEEFNKLAALQKNVDEAKNIVAQNLEKVVQRNEDIVGLQDKAVALNVEAKNFHKTGKELHSTLWYQNAKMKVVFAIICLVVAMVVLFPVLNAVGVF